MEKVTIYVDGACSGNPGPGGWGCVIIRQSVTHKRSGHELKTTNNRMELMAAIDALRSIEPSDVDIYTDSKYVQQGITSWIHKWMKNGWKSAGNGSVKNVDLWKQLLSEAGKHKIKWQWVKGHSGNDGNELADELARLARDEAAGISIKEGF